ncbi:MAG: trypsin-like peptidase domain-containing protein, partial [Candidatus Limnocylindrales bacterium]
MHQRQPGAQSHRRAIALFATAAVLVAGCADLAPPTVLSSDAAGSGGPPSQLPAIDLPLPNGDTDTTQVLLENAGGVFDVYRSVGRLAGASLACTLVLVDAAPGVTTGPAYALTNGHCVGINGNDVLVDQPLDGATAVFDYFADTPERREVPVTKVVYASMKGTDLAILQLDATVGALADAGYHPWPIGDIGPLDGSSRDVIMTGAPVGAPIVDIPEAERYLRLGTCSLDTNPVRINERLWLWSALRNDCPEVLPGNSGSPVIDIETATLVGLINTTTYKGENGAPCWLGRPCEVVDNGEDALPDTSYAMPLGSLSGCFAADGSFA